MENKSAIIENLEALLAAVEARPETLINLNSFRAESGCGTLFCVAGLACTMPRFQALGMKWQYEDRGDPEVNGNSVWFGGGDPLFGPDSMSELFQYKGGGALDYALGLTGEGGYLDCTDKELAIARLKRRIETYKGEQ